MFLHLGGDVVVSLKDVIAVLDLRTAGQAAASRDFLSLSATEKRLVPIAGGEPKSVVLTDSKVYFSPISSLTLQKRASWIDGKLHTRLT